MEGLSWGCCKVIRFVWKLPIHFLAGLLGWMIGKGIDKIFSRKTPRELG